READAFNIDPFFYGRENDVSEIVKTMTALPNGDQVLSILPIVGMGGLGKSTFAREVFHQEAINSHFAKRFWVYVSEKFDAKVLFKNILQSLRSTAVDLGNKQAIDDFISSLAKVSSVSGNGIIVTIFHQNVASLVKTLHVYKLSNLSEDECWSIIKAKVIGERENGIPFEFETVGASIAKGCYAILKVSFDHLLPPLLKKCFAYCSIYPNECKFEMELLVELWMGERCLGKNDDIDILGNKLFNGLLGNLLLQYTSRSSSMLNSSDQVRYIRLQSCASLNEQANCLRSLFSNDKACVLMFLNFKSMHIYLLEDDCVEKFPSSINELLYFRCLDFSELSDLISCDALQKLPNTLEHMMSLRHLHIPQIELPTKIGTLKCLQILPVVLAIS
ncbi:hypothetical protein MIMGU_mgv1a018202mg, partial [Erythranthe guttata]